MRRVVLFVIVSVIVLGLLAPAQGLAQDASASERAQYAESLGDTQNARTIYEELSRSVDPREAAEGLYRLGVLSDGSFEFSEALRLYRASVARDPSSRYAGRAIARSNDLEGHREAGFAPLVALESLRRDVARSNDPRAIEAFERQAEGFPPGPCRAEAWLLVGDAYIGRLSRPRDAARVFRRLASDPGADDDVKSLAATRLVEARSMLGEEGEAVREVAAARARPEIQLQARVLARRKSLHHASLGVLTLLGLAALGVAVTVQKLGLSRSVFALWKRPLPLCHIAVFSLGGPLLAWKSDGHDPWPFFALGAGTLCLHLLGSAWNLVGSAHRVHRFLRGAACALGVLSVSFLAMELLDTMMLEGIRL